MLEEKDIIRLFLEEMAPNPDRQHPFFYSDAEVLDIGGRRLLFTMDSFDAEDHFRTDDPFILGCNLATCTVSDIFASGGTVLHYGHSVSVPPEWDAPYIRQFSKGIADVLARCGGHFAGGDLGRSPRWHYTGVALGTAYRMLTRQGARPGDALYVSGDVGAGNAEAAVALLGDGASAGHSADAPGASFPLRHQEALLVERCASACIDTSDGLLTSLMLLASINHAVFSVGDIPWHTHGAQVLAAFGLPVELLAAGECGEYELLCTVPPSREDEFVRSVTTEGFSFHRIGRITPPGTAMLYNSGHALDVRDFAISARQFVDHRAYVRQLTAYIKNKCGIRV